MCILCGNIKTIKLGIKNLDCSICPSITSIPHIEGLQGLNCFGCPSITNIPHIEGLQELICSHCPSITSIPRIPNDNIICSGCKWLDVNNSRFDDNIKQLKRLQIWFRGILLGNRLKKITLELIPLYYHPLAKGGYLHKRDMLCFVKSIRDSSCIS